ncbi:Glucooligosaccharide oxidase [Xylaria nigripes]|nr:Glucooligosaccharide oxidase [Xylaria nigripes]
MRSISAAFGAALYAASVNAIPAELAHPASVAAAFTRRGVHWDRATVLSVPNTDTFNNVTMRWDSNIHPDYAIAISAATEDDVVQAVKISKAIKAPFLATGGRHATSTTIDMVQNGINIDLSRFNSVKVDASAGTLTVGGGVRFGDIYDSVFEAGFIMPVGSCSCPGMVGATIGGGVGRYQGLFGLIIDSLLSVRLVIADGTVLTVSEQSNPDLFWGIRGAGANFGIILEATYKMAPQTNGGQVLNADFILPASSNASYFDILADLQRDMPAELATITIMAYNAARAEPEIIVNWVYIGPEGDAERFIAPLRQLNPISSSVSMVPYNKLVATAAGGLGDSICSQTKINSLGVNYKNLDSRTFKHVFSQLSDFYNAFPDGRTSTVEMEIFSNDAVKKVPNHATAYPWRESRGYSIIAFGFESAATEKSGLELGREIRSEYAAGSGFDDLAVYVSYGYGDESLPQLFGGNVERLKNLKRKYDPHNAFAFYHSLA